jgi:hypothetical protein
MGKTLTMMEWAIAMIARCLPPRHCQLNAKSLTDAFPLRESDGVQMAKRPRFMKEQNSQEFFLYCTNV